MAGMPSRPRLGVGEVLKVAGLGRIRSVQNGGGKSLPRRHAFDGGRMADEQSDLTAANSYIEAELATRLKAVEDAADADALVCIHPIHAPFDDLIRDQLEDIKDKRESLLVILETDGGSIETCERIADTLRYHYPKGEIAFLVPNHAMSAGTILIMSGDRILMDYYSVLGPIDPQIENLHGHWVPALGYLETYEELVARSGSKRGLSQAELAFLLDKFDPAELFRFVQAREHSVDLLQRWLVQYKFKNWKRTATRKLPVTNQMKKTRAKQIATKLNSPKKWRSHGRGLSIEVVRRDLNLIVEDFGTEPSLGELNKRVRSYYRLLQDYMFRRMQSVVVQTREAMIAG